MSETGERPRREALYPVRRHFLRRVRTNTPRRETNSVIDPSVNVAEDIAAINRGNAIRQGQDWLVNGRRYRLEESGRAYPVDGDGVYPLTRGQYRALGAYNEYGVTAQAERFLDGNHVPEGERAIGQQVHLRGVRP